MKARPLISAILLLLQGLAQAQVLDLPPRPANALTGSQLVNVLAPLPREQREEQIFSEVMWGNIPDFLRTLVPVTSSGMVGGSTQSVTTFVTPDYLALGSNDDYVLMPMTPILAQRIADATRCILPTRKMVNDIYAAAPLKLAPAPISPSAAMITIPVFAQHDSMVWVQRSAALATHPLGTLVGGTKKDVVISNKIRNDLKTNVPKPVVIYGWHQLNGSPIQPLYNGHEETYADYSHGIRLVRDSVQLNGVPMTITSILQDAALAVLLSDEGPIAVPRYGSAPSERETPSDNPPQGSLLYPNFPNPFNPHTTICFELSAAADVHLAVYDLLGRELRVLTEGRQGAGVHTVVFSPCDLPSGAYVYELETGSFVARRAMLLIR